MFTETKAAHCVQEAEEEEKRHNLYISPFPCVGSLSGLKEHSQFVSKGEVLTR